MKLFFIKSAIFLLFFPAVVFPQMHEDYQFIEELIEEMISLHATDIYPEIIYDDLLYYLSNPLNINEADENDLKRLHFINELQIANLLEYRRIHGDMITVYELLYVEGFSPYDVKKIEPFITLHKSTLSLPVSPQRVIRYGRHQLFLRMQRLLREQKGFAAISDSASGTGPNSCYLGSPLKIYNRYQFNYQRRVQTGFVGEKDQGEEFFKGTNPNGFDYYSGHLQINDTGKFKTIVLGDFQSSFGQGLVLWSGLALGKSSGILNIKKSFRGLQKYSSTNENIFFRGVGATYRISDNMEGSIFFSRKKIDAGVSLKDSAGKILEVSSLQNTGIHATNSQMAGKNVLGETIIGSNINFNHRLFRIGTTMVAMGYDAALEPPSRIYNQFDFRGNRNIAGGFDYQFSAGSARFFGEAAVSSSGGTALLAGMVTNLSSKLSIASLYRNYARSYHSYFSSGFRENTRTSNERGFYFGALLQPFRRWRLSAYFDFFSFPWMRYGAYAPSSGIEYFLQVNYDYSAKLNMYLNFRHKDKPVNSPAKAGHIRYLYDSGTSRLRYHVNYFIVPSLEFRNRLEFSEYNREDLSPERGFLLYHDILYKPAAIPLSFALRGAFFSTDSYNARFYAYENDILYSFSIPAYYDSGYRTYLLVQYSAGRAFDLWVRYSLTKLPGRQSIGSGLNQIAGNGRPELKAQVRLRF